VLAQDPRLLVTAPSARPMCPYKGSSGYDEQDAELFVGREGLIEELIARLVDGRLVVVVGPSGAGKSSLVRAGLVPALRGGALRGSASWTVACIVPGSEPGPALDRALADHPDLLVVDQAEEALLVDDARAVTTFADRVVAALTAGTRVVLAVRAGFYALISGHAALARRTGTSTEWAEVLPDLPYAAACR
jgi:hypothetical protein